MARQALTVTQAAAELNMARITVLRLYHAGQLQGFRLTTAQTSHIRILTDSVEQFKELQERQPAGAKRQPA